MPVPPYGTSYFDQQGNFHLNGGVFYGDGTTEISLASAVAGPSSAVDGKVVLFDGTTGKLIKDSGLSLSGTNTGDVASASTSEINTGTDATKTVTPDALAGSNFGKRSSSFTVIDYTTNCATGDGKLYFRIPSALNGMNLVSVHAGVVTAGTTNTMDVQIARMRPASASTYTTVDMLSTKLTIDSAEMGSQDAAAAAVIDTSNDDVATNDQLRIDIDAVHTTPAKGLIVTLEFQLP